MTNITYAALRGDGDGRSYFEGRQVELRPAV